MTLTDQDLGLSDSGGYGESARLSLPLFGLAITPQIVVLLGLTGVLTLTGLAAVVVAGVGVVSIAVYRQYAARVAGRPGYERSTALHRLMALAIVTSVVLLGAVVIPFALDTATGACACG